MFGAFAWTFVSGRFLFLEVALSLASKTNYPFSRVGASSPSASRSWVSPFGLILALKDFRMKHPRLSLESFSQKKRINEIHPPLIKRKAGSESTRPRLRLLPGHAKSGVNGQGNRCCLLPQVHSRSQQKSHGPRRLQLQACQVILSIALLLRLPVPQTYWKVGRQLPGWGRSASTAHD